MDCRETPEARHLAWCKVKGKTQAEIVEICRKAALGSLWFSSPHHSYGTKDPNLWANANTCARGAGIHIDDSTLVMGWPKAGKPDGAIEYILVRGSGSSVDIFEHTFNAAGAGARLGFVAKHDEEMTEKIVDLYMSFGSGE
jgi:hypothetical protein